MASNQLPVLTLDFSDEKIQKLQAIADQFKNLMGGGAFPSPRPVPGTGGGNCPGVDQGGKTIDQFMKELNKESNGTLKTFKLINKTLQQTTSTLKQLFTMTLSWGTKLAAFDVLGYHYMAKQTTAQLMGSQGLNMTTGQMQAAHSVYGTRFSSTDTVIQALSSAQRNPGSPEYKAMQALGLNPQDDPGKNLLKFYAAIDRVRKQNGNNTVQALLGMGLGFADSTLVNQVKANSDQLPLYGQQYAQRSGRLDRLLPPGVQRSYQSTYSHLSDNTDQILDSFKTSIASLNGPLKQLSDAITKNITGFLNGPNGEATFTAIADGLTRFAKWLNSESFQKDLQDFETDIGDFIRAIGHVARFILHLFGDDTETKKSNQSKVEELKKKSYFEQEIPGTPTRPGVPVPGKPDGSLWGGAKALGNTISGIFGVVFGHAKGSAEENIAHNRNNTVPPMQDYHDRYAIGILRSKVADKNFKARLPMGMLAAVAQEESSFNPNAVNGDHVGLFQFSTDTAKRFGLSPADRTDPIKEMDAAARYFQDNLKRYHGDIAKSLAQYNGGNIAVSGNKLNLRAETVKYLLDLLPKIGNGEEYKTHPYLERQLERAQYLLSSHPKGRATIQLDVKQMPGSDLGVQVAGASIPH